MAEEREIKIIFTEKGGDKLEKKVDKVAGALTKVEKSSKKAKKELSGRGGLGDGLESLNGLATEAGGSMATAAGFIEKLGFASKTAAGGGIGALIAGTGAAAAGIGVLVASSVAATRAAKEWIKELEKFDALGLGVAPEDVARVNEANLALDTMGTEAKRLGVEIASNVAPAVISLAEGIAGITDAASKAGDSWSDYVTWLYNVQSILNPVLWAVNAVGWAMGNSADDTEEFTEKMRDLSIVMQGEVGPSYDAFIADQKALTKELADAAEAAKKKADAEAEADRKRWKAKADAQAKTLKQIQDISRKSSIAVMDDQAAVIASYADRIQAVRDMATTTEQHLAAMVAVENLETEREAKLTEMVESETAKRIAARDLEAANAKQNATEVGNWIAEKLQEGYDKAEAAAERSKVIVAGVTDAAVDTVQTVLSVMQDMYQSQIDTILEGGRTMADGQKKLSAQEKEALTKSVRNQKKTAIASALISGLAAAAAAIASPPGPPVSFAYLAPVAAATAASVAGIAGQEVPTLAHSGTGRVGDAGDERTMRLQNSEAVLNAAARQAVGGTAGVDALNSGGGLGGAMTLQHRWKHNILGREILELSRSDGPGGDVLYSGGDGRSTAIVQADTSGL